MKVDKTVRRETFYLSAVCFALSAVMQAVFIVFNKWDYTVLIGNVFGFVASVGNFFIMSLTVQNAIGLDEKEIKTKVKISQRVRFFAMLLLLVIGIVLPFVNSIAMLVPMFFPRISVMVRPLFGNMK